MDTIFMSSENSKTSDPHRLLLNLGDRINLQGSDKYDASSGSTASSIYNTWKNIRKSYKNNKFKVSAPKWKMRKNWSFPSRTSAVNVTKPAVSYRFGLIYWKNP